MGLLTLLDSRSHRNLAIWKEIVRLMAYMKCRRSFGV